MKNDSRINVESIPLANRFMVFLISMVLCGGFTFIYLRLGNNATGKLYLALSLLTYIVIFSVYICFIIDLFRRRLLMPPVRRLQEAARKVAQGDFTVQIPPQRKDGKKDEFEVLYEDFNAMILELASTEMLKKDFISNVSHELKTPLAVIQNYASIIQSDHLNEMEQREYIEKIMDASKRLSVLVSNILQLSRLENQKIVVNKKSYNLSEQLCRCILGFEKLMDEKEINLDFQSSDELIIYNNEELLDIIWNNLISNALKFSRQGGMVCIGMEKSLDGIIVTIEDNGCGISQEAIRHIFDKFYQGDIFHASQGNGLGLAMVKQIVTLLNASISVDSSQNVGTRFTVLIPTI